MSNGLSLHIGINTLKADHYGIVEDLYGCENDANAMKSIAENEGFKSKVLLTDHATYQNVENEIKDAALLLDSGDIFMLTYSGHG